MRFEAEQSEKKLKQYIRVRKLKKKIKKLSEICLFSKGDLTGQPAPECLSVSYHFSKGDRFGQPEPKTNYIYSDFKASGENMEVIGQNVGCATTYVLTGEDWVEKFNGDGTILFTTWLSKLEDIMDLALTPMSDKQKVNRLKYHLTGMARIYFDSLTEDVKKSYSEVKKAMKSKFEGERIKEAAEQKLANVVHRGSVGELVVEIRDLVEAALAGEEDTVKEKRMLGEFVRKLKPEIRYQVKLGEPKTFAEAMESAFNIEDLLNERGDGIMKKIDGLAKILSQNAIDRDEHECGVDNEGGGIACHYCGINGHVMRNCRIRITDQEQNGTSSNCCGYCGIFGHIEMNCWKRMRQNGMTNVNCFACGEFGHRERECNKQDPEEQLGSEQPNTNVNRRM